MKSYFKFLSRNKLYTAIEAVGLVVSLAFVIYMGCYVAQQFMVAKENPEHERICVVGQPNWAGLSYEFGDIVEERFPEVELTCKLYSDLDWSPAVFGNEKIKYSAMAVDKKFFEMFPYYSFVEGSPDVFDVKSNVIVSRTFAEKLSDIIQGQDIIGHTIILNDKEFTIGGIIEDFHNTFFKYTDIISNIDNAINPLGALYPSDLYASILPVIRLAEDTDIEEFYVKLDNLCSELYGEEYFYGTTLFPKINFARLDKLFFEDIENSDIMNSGNLRQLMVLLGIAVLLLVSSILNYVNLNSALIGRRSKEMAVNSILGASRKHILGKFISESIVFTAICMLVALILAIAITPVLNGILHADIETSVAFSPWYILIYILVVPAIGVLNAIVPTWLSFRYRPVDVVKGKQRAEGKSILGKVFITVQAALAVGLISMAICMEMQFHKALNREKSFNTGNMIFLEKSHLGAKGSAVLFDRIKELPFVEEIGLTNGIPGTVSQGFTTKNADGTVSAYKIYMMDTVSFRILGFKKIESFVGNSDMGTWLGQTGYNYLLDGYGQINANFEKLKIEEVRGIIEDFPTEWSNTGAQSMIQVHVYNMSEIEGDLLIKVQDDSAEAKEQIHDVYKDVMTESVGLYIEPYNFDYMEDFYRKSLAESERQMRLIEIFMVIAVLLSLMGMLAMSTYEAQVRRHDIALRKVHGATVGDEVGHGVLSYMKMVAVASVIAVPVAVYAADRYLQQFIVKIEGYWWIFVVAVVLTALIALLSIFWQILRAARTNPVEVLNKE